MTKWAVLMATLAMSILPSAAAPANPLALGQRTPRGACSSPEDCGFKRGAINYTSFDKIISRREACAPVNRLFEAARKGDRLEVVRLRLRRQDRMDMKAEQFGDGWHLFAASRSSEFMSMEVTFDRSGRVKCVTEMLTTV